MFLLREIVRSGEPRVGDWGVMIAIGPGMAAEVGCSDGRAISQAHGAGDDRMTITGNPGDVSDGCRRLVSRQ